MVTITRQLVSIDADITIEQLLDSWQRGFTLQVISYLKKDHPGLTAFLITEGIKRKIFKLNDINQITNLLIDDRIDLLNKPN